MWRLSIIARFSCLPFRSIFPRISSHVRPCDNVSVGSLRPRSRCDSTCRDQGFEQVFAFMHNLQIRLSFTLRTPQENLILQRCRFAEINLFHQFVPHGGFRLFFVPLFLRNRSHSHGEIILSRGARMGIPTLELFPIHFLPRLFSNCRSHSSPVTGCPHKFLSCGNTES